ncbi:MAG TPA: hypothetical protein PK079_14810 [Leptospiraceae bacterium]|nr:hypothetical protein [Leptospiraceae bacterium]HMW07842.1 hypothetical protein [Leptospiraceae bacterium]HMX34810.1 hypothetical protein [Leptospiraceae bacterium]HMY33472.1 hypothetical protein [Leptospiraceae bacterium]HMZ65993.1 hypothetical protein [Leptospiraceae bacterium]
MDLHKTIKNAIDLSAPLSELKSILIHYKEEGGTKEDAHMQLYELLQDASTNNEDFLLRELIDFTIGYSGKIPTIWD